jgi:hypothetical protein
MQGWGSSQKRNEMDHNKSNRWLSAANSMALHGRTLPQDIGWFNDLEIISGKFNVNK